MVGPAGSAAGLYLHIPFCSAICPYCDFTVVVGDNERRRRFVASLLAEIRLWAGYSRPFDTVYFGGGTPSTLTPNELAEVLQTLRANLSIHEKCRISMEVNPEDATPERLGAYRQLGVHTVSLGIQSFDALSLHALGRRHTPRQARESVRAAQDAGFPIVSLDLIYGLPGQCLEAWRRDLRAAIGLDPDHLSCYQLTVHRRTALGRLEARGELVQLSEDGQADMFLTTHEVLNDAGYQGYEVSNFASSPGQRSRHNLKYWRHVDYLGLGPSAHSFSGGTRWWNQPRLIRWHGHIEAGKKPILGAEELAPADLALERLILALRTHEGLDLGLFADHYGIDLLQTNGARIAQWIDAGLVVMTKGRMQPTIQGLTLADFLARSLELEASLDQ